MSDWVNICGSVNLITFTTRENGKYREFKRQENEIDKQVVGIKKHLGNISSTTEYKENIKLPKGMEGTIKYDIIPYVNEGEPNQIKILLSGSLRDYNEHNIKTDFSKWLNKSFVPNFSVGASSYITDLGVVTLSINDKKQICYLFTPEHMWEKIYG